MVPGGRRWVEPEARRRLSFDHVRIVPRDDAALTVDGGPEKARSQRSGTRESLLDRLRPLSLAPDAGQVQAANDIVDARVGLGPGSLEYPDGIAYNPPLRGGRDELVMRAPLRNSVGTWRSLVAHLNGVQGVRSSNLRVPTTF